MAYGDYINFNNHRLMDVTPLMTSMTTPEPYEIISNSDIYSIEYAHENIFDDDEATYYITKKDIAPKGRIVGLDFGKDFDVVINAFYLHLRLDNGLGSITPSFNITASNDLLDWDVLYSKTGSKSGNYYEFEGNVYIDNNKIYRYFALDIIKSAKVSNATKTRFYEFKFYVNKDNLKIEKILNYNIPVSITDSTQHLLFSDEYKTFVSKADGTIVEMDETPNLIGEFVDTEKSNAISYNNGLFINNYKNRKVLCKISEDTTGEVLYDAKKIIHDYDSKADNNAVENKNNVYSVIIDNDFDNTSDRVLVNSVITKKLNDIEKLVK